MESFLKVWLNKLTFLIAGILQNFRKDYGQFKTFKSMIKFNIVENADATKVGNLIYSPQMNYFYSNKNP